MDLRYQGKEIPETRSLGELGMRGGDIALAKMVKAISGGGPETKKKILRKENPAKQIR